MLGTHELKIIQRRSVWQLPDDFWPVCTAPRPNRTWSHDQLLWNEHSEKSDTCSVSNLVIDRCVLALGGIPPVRTRWHSGGDRYLTLHSCIVPQVSLFGLLG